jgi:cytochrome P450
MPARRRAPGRDLLSQLSLLGDPEGRDDHALASSPMTVMFGAYDTTSMSVASMAYLLARYPAWQERLRAEAQRADAHDWASMPQLEWAWKETQRLMPVSGVAPRRALRDLELQGHPLRAGTFVALMLGQLGRCRQVFADPLTFDPERFSPARSGELARGSYLAFGAGPHSCIGMQLAGIEAKMLFHGLLTKTRFTLVRDVGLRHAYDPLGSVHGKVELQLVRL